MIFFSKFYDKTNFTKVGVRRIGLEVYYFEQHCIVISCNVLGILSWMFFLFGYSHWLSLNISLGKKFTWKGDFFFLNHGISHKPQGSWNHTGQCPMILANLSSIHCFKYLSVVVPCHEPEPSVKSNDLGDTSLEKGQWTSRWLMVSSSTLGRVQLAGTCQVLSFKIA